MKEKNKETTKEETRKKRRDELKYGNLLFTYKEIA